ncbi:hypothetical protein T492DRAFT_122807 [Pavlovales sp. CCMP2436]|nr:hypothetical protein T492DRAFT_122807 [Pavlovales sp. CCMP2436]
MASIRTRSGLALEPPAPPPKRGKQIEQQQVPSLEAKPPLAPEGPPALECGECASKPYRTHF